MWFGRAGSVNLIFLCLCHVSFLFCISMCSRFMMIIFIMGSLYPYITHVNVFVFVFGLLPFRLIQPLFSSPFAKILITFFSSIHFFLWILIKQTHKFKCLWHFSETTALEMLTPGMVVILARLYWTFSSSDIPVKFLSGLPIVLWSFQQCLQI